MRIRLLALLVLAVAGLGSTWAAAQYFGPILLNVNSGSHGEYVEVNMMVSFGNGTKVWYNSTQVPSNWTFYDTTFSLTKGQVVAKWNGGYRSHFVYKILGLGCNPEDVLCPGYWSLWVWNQKGSCWSYSTAGADLMKVANVRAIAWHFLYYDNSNLILDRCR